MITIQAKHGHLIRFIVYAEAHEVTGAMGSCECANCGAFAFLHCGHAGKDHTDEALFEHITAVVEAIEARGICEGVDVAADKREVDITLDWRDPH